MEFIRNKVEEWSKEKIRKFTIENFDKIENDNLLISMGFRNAKCQWNSYNEQLLYGEHIKVMAVMCLGKTDVFVHFINYDSTTGKYYDITLGTSGLFYEDYYVIGESIECEDNLGYYLNMDKRLMDLKKWVIDKCHTNKYVNKYLKRCLDKDNYF